MVQNRRTKNKRNPKSDINKFIRLEKRLSPILISLGIFSIGFFAAYHSFTGDYLLDIRATISYFLYVIALSFALFFTVIFPKRYPEDFELYKKHVKENYDFKGVKRALVGLPLILIGFVLFVLLISPKGVKDIDRYIIFDIIAVAVICGMGLYHIHQIEK
jgi:membrane protease YdiL (CAAX protease family)